MKDKRQSPKVKRNVNRLYDIIQILIGFVLCFALYFLLFYVAKKVFGKIELTTDIFMLIVTIIGFTFLPTGVWIGRAIRFGNIYHDLYSVESKTEYFDHKHAVDEYGRDKGWIE